MRLPRKLKKGCRTLKGRPRTKWQRKGQIQKKRLLENIANTACAAAVGMELLRQAAKKVNPVTFPSGGIVVPPPKVGVAQMSTGEMIVAREQVGVRKAIRREIMRKVNFKDLDPEDLHTCQHCQHSFHDIGMCQKVCARSGQPIAPMNYIQVNDCEEYKSPHLSDYRRRTDLEKELKQ